MPFPYIVFPKKGGGVTARPDGPQTMSAADFIALVTQRSGRAQDAVSDILRHAAEAYIDLAKEGRRVEPLHGLLGMMPVCGGSHPNADFVGTLENLKASLTLFPGKEGAARFAHNFTAVRTGVEGFKTALVTEVVNKSNGARDQYRSQKGLALGGSRLAIKLGDPRNGLFFQSEADQSIVRVADSDILINEPKRLLVLPPPGLSGRQRLIVKTLLRGTYRTFHYGVVLTEAAG